MGEPEVPLEIKNDSVTRYLVEKGPDILIQIAFFRPQPLLIRI